MILWQSSSSNNKCQGLSWGRQLIAHKLPIPFLSSLADVLEPCLTHRIPYQIGPSCWSLHVGPVQQTNLSILVHGPHMTTSKNSDTWIPCFSFSVTKLSRQVHGPHMTTSKNFGAWILCFFCFSFSVTTLALSIWFHNLCATFRSTFWLPCWAPALQYFLAGPAQLAVLPPLYLWLHSYVVQMRSWICKKSACFLPLGSKMVLLIRCLFLQTDAIYTQSKNQYLCVLFPSQTLGCGYFSPVHGCSRIYFVHMCFVVLFVVHAPELHGCEFWQIFLKTKL